MTRLTLSGAAALAAFATSACVLPPGGYAAPYQTAQAGYPPPAEYPPGYYPPPPPPAYPDAYTFSYIDGYPYALFGGQQEIVIFDPGLGWGFYDPYHHWHPAPDRWRNEFEHRYPGGRGYAPPPPREFGARPGAPPPGRPPEGFRPGAFQPEPGRPGGPGPERAPERPPERGPEPRVNAPRPEAARPEAPHPEAARAPAPAPRPAGRVPACGEPGAPRC
jgi:hypothetical protein